MGGARSGGRLQWQMWFSCAKYVVAMKFNLSLSNTHTQSILNMKNEIKTCSVPSDVTMLFLYAVQLLCK